MAINHVDNMRANQQFLEGLTSRRHEQAMPEPVVTPLLQRQLTSIAEMLQSGQLSVAEAQRASERWGRDAYRREVETWVIDCGHGLNMPFPSALITRPTVVLAYASAYHHPPSAPSPQCATLIVSPMGAVK